VRVRGFVTRQAGKRCKVKLGRVTIFGQVARNTRRREVRAGQFETGLAVVPPNIESGRRPTRLGMAIAAEGPIG